jgi:GGDEF domain-containing protein
MRHPALRPNARSRQPYPTDPTTGFGSRDQLIDDLDQALDPGSSFGVLAVFDLAGSEQHRRLFGAEASDALIARLAEVCARAVATNGRCYRPRQDEFCVLLELEVDDAISILEDTLSALRDEGSDSLGPVAFGVALLPEEANDAIDALIIADQDLDTRRHQDRRSEGAHPSSWRGQTQDGAAELV